MDAVLVLCDEMTGDFYFSLFVFLHFSKFYQMNMYYFYNQDKKKQQQQGNVLGHERWTSPLRVSLQSAR